MAGSNIVSDAFPHLAELEARARTGACPKAAVVQPVSEDALGAALDAADAGLIAPIFVGDAARMRQLAARCGRDITGIPLVDAPSDPEAAAAAVALVRGGDAQVLMKGHIHTDDFLRPALSSRTGLRTDRLMSHVFVCYLPVHIYPKPLFVTDGAMNIAPGLREKHAILTNAIELAHAIGIAEPKIAILAATETVNPAMPATVDAAALCEEFRNGEFPGAIVDGPFAFDNAISRRSAEIKGITSPVAGDPDVLLVPDIEAGNICYKQMVHFSGAITPGLVIGASAPIMLTSRADPRAARRASCALAAAYAAYAAASAAK